MIRDITLGQYYPVDSVIHRLDPRTCLLYTSTKAEKMEGQTGENMMILLERRLDNVIFRMGFGRTRRETRQIVDHKHILVNGKCVNIPSYLVKAGDVIEVKEKAKSAQRYKDVLEVTSGRLDVYKRQSKQGKKLTLNLGYSHPVEMEDPEGLETVLEGQNKITVKGIDKEKVGQYAAEIRDKRRPEPYKGKGIKYADETIRRKVGKTGKK